MKARVQLGNGGTGLKYATASRVEPRKITFPRGTHRSSVILPLETKPPVTQVRRDELDTIFAFSSLNFSRLQLQ